MSFEELYQKTYDTCSEIDTKQEKINHARHVVRTELVSVNFYVSLRSGIAGHLHPPKID